METHAIADIFPQMGDAQFVALKNDIAAHGVRNPAWIWQGALIDGRHRFRACAELGIKCPTKVYEGDEAGALALVVSLNSKRRDLTASQLAMVALAIEEYEAKLAKARMAKGGGDKKSGKEKIPDPIVGAGQARDKAVTADDVEKYVAKRQKQAKPKERIEAEADRCGQVEDLHSLAASGVKFQTVYADPAWKYGNQVFCSDGVSYQLIGNQTFGSDGTTSTRIDNHRLNSDGSSSMDIGNTRFRSDGSSSQRIGNTIFNSDGTSCQRVGDHLFCN